MTTQLIVVTLGMFVGLNAIGLLASYAVILIQPKAMKIQPRQPTLKAFNRRLPLIVLNVAIISAATAGGIYLFRDFFVFERPVWWALMLQVVYLSVVDDIFFYPIHRMLHENKLLYRRIHKIHHRAHTPVPSEYLYVHPLEWMLGATGVVAGFVSLAWFSGGLNVWPFLIYSGLRQLHELQIHSGLRSTLGNYIPFWGTTEHHDLHHARPTLGNYASTYTLWDQLLGTRVR